MADPREYLQQEEDLRSTTPAERPRMLKYYKDPSYFTKNWAPEQIPEDSVRALAKAAALAVKQGVLSPQLADKMLANSLIEGFTGGPATVTLDKTDPESRSGKEETGGLIPTTPQFGVDYLGYDGPDIRANLQKMGVRVADANAYKAGDPADVLFSISGEGFDPRGPGHAPLPGYYPNRAADANSNAKLAAVMLAKKAQLYGEDKAIERWNGQGPRAQRHAQRVEMMQQMLQHPSNRALLDAYTKYRDEP